MRGFLLLVFLAHVSLLQAQDNKSINKLTLQYGIHFFSRQDQLFSPMIYHATSPLNLNLQYTNKNDKRIHLAEAEFNLYKASWHDQYDFFTGFDEIKTQTTLPSGFTVVTARYAYLRYLNSTSIGEWWIGGITDNQINSIDNEYGPAATFGYFAHFSLAPVVQWRYQLSDRHDVHAIAWLPILSWVSRSPYAVHDDEYMQNNADHNGFKTFFRYVGDGNIHLLNRYQQFNLNLGYSYALSKNWDLGAEYRFEFFRDSKPKTVISYQNFINLQASFIF